MESSTCYRSYPVMERWSIFPSEAARDKFDLEYRQATVTKEPIKQKEGDTGEAKTRNVYEFPSGTGMALTSLIAVYGKW